MFKLPSFILLTFLTLHSLPPKAFSESERFHTRYCECRGSGNDRRLWLYASDIGGWRLIAEKLSSYECLNALRYPPCV